MCQEKHKGPQVNQEGVVSPGYERGGRTLKEEEAQTSSRHFKGNVLVVDRIGVYVVSVHVTVEVEGLPVKAVVDSGAEVSLSTTEFKKLNKGD